MIQPLNLLQTEADQITQEVLAKAFSASAREAAAAARRKGAPMDYSAEGGRRPEVQHETDGKYSPNSSDETDAMRARHKKERKASVPAWPSYDDPKFMEKRADLMDKSEAMSKSHGDELHEQLKKDPGATRDLMESHLSGSRGVRMTSESSEGGKHEMNFHDKLYGADGKISLRNKPKVGGHFEVTMTHPDTGQTVSANDIGNARMKMKRLYYGASNPNQTMRQQGFEQTRFGVGRNARG